MTPKYLTFLLLTLTASLLVLAACSPASPGVVTLNKDGSTQVSQGGAPGSSQANLTEPGASAGGGGDQLLAPQWGPPVLYTDPTYQFSLTHPSDFVMKTLSPDQIAALKPQPAATYVFINPVSAVSTLADEPPDLQVLVYRATGVTSLKDWLSSVSLAGAGATSTDFKTDTVSGIKVCSSTMIFPACRSYVLGKDWIFQLTSYSVDGDNMLNSFALSK